jgi:HlyD family secretion protein
MNSQIPFSARRSIARHLLAGVALVGILAGGVGGWASTTEISGAVIAPGTLVVDTNVKKVQHPTGGIVGELRVKDGDHVKANDILVRLDDTQTRANLAIVTKALDELAARQARETAERDGAAEISFPAELLRRRSTDPTVANLVDGEQRLFAIRRFAREGQKSQLRERVGQIKEEIQGLTDQAAAKRMEIQLIGKELEGVRDLYAKNLIQLPRLTALERDAARIGGERGQLTAQIAQAKGKMTETELQILQLDQDLRSEVAKDLAEIRGKTSEYEEKKISADDQLKRIDIRSPQNGVVHQMSVHTIGGLVTPSEPVMLIVPEAEALTVEVKVQPQDIDHVRLGQAAVLRFSAFNQRTTPEINGVVTRVSADVTQDPKTGASYYTARVGLPEGELGRLAGLKLVPGMPVESFIKTGERTVLSFLVKPLHDQVMKAFRER